MTGVTTHAKVSVMPMMNRRVAAHGGKKKKQEEEIKVQIGKLLLILFRVLGRDSANVSSSYSKCSPRQRCGEHAHIIAQLWHKFQI